MSEQSMSTCDRCGDTLPPVGTWHLCGLKWLSEPILGLTVQECESSPIVAPEPPGIVRADAKEAPMSDERLAEIEEWMAHADHDDGVCPFRWPCMAEQLVAEVRRLRTALRLSEASRGVPNGGAVRPLSTQGICGCCGKLVDFEHGNVCAACIKSPGVPVTVGRD